MKAWLICGSQVAALAFGGPVGNPWRERFPSQLAPAIPLSPLGADSYTQERSQYCQMGFLVDG